MPKVTIWPHRELLGWDGTEASFEAAPRVQTRDLHDALTATYRTDAHFVPYHLRSKETLAVEREIVRVNKKALSAIEKEGLELVFDVLVLDVDMPGHARLDPAWWTAQKTIIYGLPWAESLSWFQTRNGYRLLAVLPKALGVEDYLSLGQAFREGLRGHGINADELKDFGRCYRLPYVVRDGEIQRLDADLSKAAPLLYRRPTAPIWNADEGKASTGTFSGVGKSKTAAERKIPERITENRNVTLTRLAGVLHNLGFTDEDKAVALRMANEQRCEPMLPDEEIDHILASSRSWERGLPRPDASNVPTTYDPLDEDDLLYEGLQIKSARPTEAVGRRDGVRQGTAPRFTAESDTHFAEHALADLEPNGVKLVHDRGALWRYSPKLGRWLEFPEQIVSQLIASWDGETITLGTKVKPFVANLGRMNGICEVLVRMRHAPEFFEKERAGMVFRNGFVTVEKGKVVLLPHDPAHRATCHFDFDFRAGEAGANPVTFLRFLRSCFTTVEGKLEDEAEFKIALLQEFVGACILGRATAYQRGLILTGIGANGKSTFQDIIEALFAGKTITNVPPQDMDNEYRRALLAGSRLNMVAELPETDILASEAVKAMISGDRVVGRHIREAPFSFRPKAGQLYSANALPVVADLTDGFFRRWIIVPFDRKFSEEEQEAHLAKKIIATDLPEIAAWALEGASRLEAKGRYTTTADMHRLVREWREASDPVLAFVTARCVIPEQGAAAIWTNAHVLYSNYARWANGSGHRPVSETKFGRRLVTLGIEKRKVSTAQYNLSIRTFSLVPGGSDPPPEG